MANGDDESFMLLLKIDDEFAGKGNNAIYTDRNAGVSFRKNKCRMEWIIFFIYTTADHIN